MTIHEKLQVIVAASAVAQLDLEAGTASGPQVRLQFDRASPDQVTPGVAERRFLTASLTKPVVALHALQLLSDGLFSLSDRVGLFLPAFNRSGLRRVTVRHLLTHTSGFPDMLPDNETLRAGHSAVSEFAAATAEVTPDFGLGTDSRYCSMGFAVLAEIVEVVTGSTLRQTLASRLFQPLDMRSSWLGMPADGDQLETVLPCELPDCQPATADWNWNSRYWRTLGAPWGGLISTASDLGLLLRALLTAGRADSGEPVLAPSVIRESFRNQTDTFAEIPESTRRTRSWGYGWRHNWPDHAACFCDLLPPNAVGHWGATGTLMWLDPVSGIYAVLLSTTPYETSSTTLQRLSNMLVAELNRGPREGDAPDEPLRW